MVETTEKNTKVLSRHITLSLYFKTTGVDYDISLLQKLQ